MKRHRPAALASLAFLLAAAIAVTGCSAAPAPSASPEVPASAAPSGTPAARSAAPSAQPASTSLAPATPAPSAPTASEPAGATSVKVYFVVYQGADESLPILAPVHRDIEPTLGVARAAMLALLEGPTDDERAHDLVVGTVGSMISPDARLLGVEVSGGTATVDLSQEFLPLDLDETNMDEYLLTLAQVTYTLTQFPTVERVAFEVEGRPQPALEGHEGTAQPVVGRDAYFDQLPAIFLDDPAWGATRSDPVRIAGRARVFEGQFQAALVDRDTGEILVERTVLADCAAGGCTDAGGGLFESELAVPDAAGDRRIDVRVWEPSPRDGTPTNIVEYPLR